MRTTALLIATTMVVLCAWSPAWGRNWVVKTMPNAAAGGYVYCDPPKDLRVDANGYGHCIQPSETVDGDYAVAYWWQDAVGWHHETPCPHLGPGFCDVALALGADGNARLATADSWWNYDWGYCTLLNLLTRGPLEFDSWPLVEIDSSSEEGSGCNFDSVSLALDASDGAHLSCTTYWGEDYEGAGLWYYHCSSDGSQVLGPEFVTEVFGPAQIVVNGLRQPGIVFGRTNGLGFALRGAAGWTQESVLSSDSPGWSAAMDGVGTVHLAYAHPSSKALCYAWRDAAGWHYQAVPGGGPVEEGPSLAVMPGGSPRVAYTGTNGDLRYAWKDASGWHVETVDATCRGYAPSLALGPSGIPYIAYDDGLAGTWRYAAGEGAPSAPTLTIRPAFPSATDNVMATATVAPQGAPLTYRFGWAQRVGDQWVQKRGRTTSSPSDTLPGSLTEHGQQWKCYVQASDGTNQSAMVEKQFAINGPPTKPTLTITPTQPRDADNVKVTISGSVDPDGDPITYWVNWSVAVGGQWVQKRGRIGSGSYDVLPASLTAPGQAWKCSVIATDESDPSVQPDRSRVVEQRFSIIADGAPTTPTLTISPPAPGPSSDVKATVSGCVDPEGDPLTYTYGWSVLVEGKWVLKRGRTTSRTYDVLPALLTEAGQQWACRVYASDGVHRTAAVEKRFTISSTGTAGVATAMVTSLSAVPTAVGAQIVFTLSAPAEVQAEVLNIAGRPVKLLTRGTPFEAGTQTMVWTGQTEAGLAAPNGRYLVRVTARNEDGAESQALGTVTVER